MWKRNLLFIGLAIGGLAWVTSSLMRGDRIPEPDSYRPNRMQRESFAAIVNKVDAEFQDHWKDRGVQPTPQADSLTVARRLAIGLIGSVPSLEEIRELEKVPEENRTEWYVSRLLEDRRYADHVAERLARTYVGTEDGPFLAFRRRRFVMWLSDWLHHDSEWADSERDYGYDRLVQKMIGGRGLWTTSPEVNFITVTISPGNDQKPDEVRLAARTVRAFLGTRIDCLQCHDENRFEGASEFPSTDGGVRQGLQKDFHQLASFFTEARSTFRGVADQNEKYEFQYLNEEETEVVPPTTPYASDLLNQDIGRRRERLAQWVTHADNKPFARTTVNRVWAIMFGTPLYDPIDNIPLGGVETPGLETLADDLIANDFDLRRLIRVIAATEVFQRAGRADFPITQEHEDAWAVFPMVRLRPEQVAGAVIQSTSLATIDASTHIVWKLKRYQEQNDFVKRYGDMGDDEFEDRGGTTSQRLLMMNGELVFELSKENPLFAPTRIALLAPDDETAVEMAFLTTLTRRPNEREMTQLAERMRESNKGRQRNAMMEDIFWMLMNSTEFSWNH